MGAVPERERAARTEALLARGIERYAAGDLRGAAAQWREALKLSPTDVQIRAYVAFVESRIAIEDPAAAAADLPTADEARSTLIRREAPGLHDQISTIPRDTRRSRPDITLTWHPSTAMVPGSVGAAAAAPVASPSAFHGVEEPVRRFLAQAPTKPNLIPLDVPELSEERVAALAGLVARQARSPAAAAPPPHATRVPAPPPPPAPSVDKNELDAVPRAVTGDRATPKNRLPFAERIASMRRLLDSGDVAGALALAEEIVGFTGDVNVPMLAEHAAALTAVYERSLGDCCRLVRLGRVPADLDARSAFLLSRVDGSFSIDDLLDISGMERVAAARLASVLFRSGALVAD